MAPTNRVGHALLLAGGILAGLLIVEGALHLLPGTLTGVAAGIPLVADKHVAFKHKPNQSATYASQCFKVTMSVNNEGFRDSDWEGPQSVVVLGDSFMEGAAVGDGEDFASVLERLLEAPVMNLGQASFGTVAELYAYRAFARPRAPSTVILMFYTGNDISDNDCGISAGPGGTIRKPCGTIVDGGVTFPTNFYSISGSHALRSFVRENCRLCTVLRNALTLWSAPPKTAVSPIPDAEDNATEDAWAITTEALRQLKDEVTADGGRLVVSSVPDYRMVEPEAPGSAIEARLIETLKNLDIDFLSLTPAFISYREQYALPAPYFSYSCDGHWNPVGHALAASLVVSYLTDHALLAPSPQAILGDPGYRGVYEGGVYTP